MTSEDNIVGKVDRMTSEYYSYAWTINNFCVCCPRADVLSPEFRTGLNNENIWVLKLRKTADWIGIHLKLKDTVENAVVEIAYVLSILNKEKQKTHDRKVTKPFNKENLSGFDQFIRIDDLKKSPCLILPNKQLTILCEIKSIYVKRLNKLRHEKLLDDLQNLFEDPKHTDAKIVVGEKTFHVHKSILVSRSLWFKAAFEGGMQEQQKNEVTVPNYDYEVVQEVLRFIYTGQVKGVENFVDRLLDAAVFYQLDELKTICSDILSDNLSLKNALQTLHLADTHRVIDLKKKALDFMSLHTNDLVNVDMTCSND